MNVLNSLLPILFLIGLGKALARTAFFSNGFFKDLNRLTYYWGLPSLMVYETARVDLWNKEGQGILYTLMIVIFITIGIAYACVPILKIPARTIGAFVQGSFRGNLAFVGYPVIYFAVGQEGLSQGMLASGVCILFYNIASVLILIRHGKDHSQGGFKTIWRYGISNPLILSCSLGFLINIAGIEIPVMINRTLQALGQIALPSALIGMGAGLLLHDLKGGLKLSVIAALINVALSPFLGYWVGRGIGLDTQSLQVAVIFLACPTAVFSYVMAEILGNDAVTARNIVILSTLISIVSLSLTVALMG